MKVRTIKKDVLIIGGGTAGCYVAGKLAGDGGLSVVVAEKANIERSGCLAAGVNALNAYITPGHTPEDYVEYAKKDADGIVREDLLLTLSRRLNEVTEDLEKMGLTILKDESGNYVSRGWRNLKINGENIKPLLAGYARGHENVTILNHVNITDFLTEEENGKIRVRGAVGFSTREELFYCIYADAVLIATGGAAGLYRPNNPGRARHRMWYCPFNTGAGYAMGLLAGAEMTTFEMRYIALRCKDTLAPVGTIAQGVGAEQVNSRGEIYEQKYGNTTAERVWGTIEEKKNGRGPCYLRTKGISSGQEKELYLAYLNMAPVQTLKWLAEGAGPSQENVELDGSEPYIVGGHTASGYWVSTERETTIGGLFAAGDVCGGAPQKYVTGVLAEAAIAAETIKDRCQSRTAGQNKCGGGEAGQSEYKSSEAGQNKSSGEQPISESWEDWRARTDDAQAVALLEGCHSCISREDRVFSGTNPSVDDMVFSTEELEEAMQKAMDEYAGGIKTNYSYNEAGLEIADEKIRRLQELQGELRARSMDELLRIYELRERLITARALIAHLRARQETRWHSFQENSDHPEKKKEFELYVNSRMAHGEIQILYRPLVGREAYYEHTD